MEEMEADSKDRCWGLFVGDNAVVIALAWEATEEWVGDSVDVEDDGDSDDEAEDDEEENDVSLLVRIVALCLKEMEITWKTTSKTQISREN